MKNRIRLLLAAAALLMCTACQNTVRSANDAGTTDNAAPEISDNAASGMTQEEETTKPDEEYNTVDFINGMTAVLDSVNRMNIREIFRMLSESDPDESQLEELAEKARQTLSSSWGVENTSDMMETVDWLMEEGHNRDALQLLEEYGGTKETDRSAFEESLKAQNLSEEMYISLMAAYDAFAAYGEGAIAAWDLSRIGTVMDFGYASGYCTYEEAMDTLLEAAKKSQSLFDSWDDFNQSYLYGYCYWAEESTDDPAGSAAERAKLVESLEAESDGPFSADWNMELKKEW